MSLTNALMIASQSLGTISSQINLVSRNIAGAGSDDVTKKTAILATGPNGSSEFRGVRRETNESMFKYLISTSAKLATSARVSDALDQIDIFLNLSDPAESRAPVMQLAKFTDSLVTYITNPADVTSAELAVQAAKNILQSIQDASSLMRELRRQADDNIATGVDHINDFLNNISDLNRDIISLTGTGTDITDMLDRRDALLRQLSEIIGIKVVLRPNQDLVIFADNGATLLETTPRYVSFQRTDNLPAGRNGAPVLIDGVIATGQGASSALLSGSIAGDILVRDNLTSVYQAQLDEMARALIVAFAEKDQSDAGSVSLPGLFTIPEATGIPAASLISGLADQIIINPTVDPSQGGDPTLLRDGGVSGNPAYVYNTEQLTGFTDRLLELAAAGDVAQIYDARTNLDVIGSLHSFMQSSIGWIGAQRQNASRERTYQNAIVTQTTVTLSSTTGVNIDEQMTQMLTLENAFQASAKLLQTINSVYEALFAAINR
jgi:flagellar hook-associated protein 1 FlgK